MSMKQHLNRLLAILIISIISFKSYAQEKTWSVNNESRSSILKNKAVKRQSFPQNFKLFNLHIEPLRQELFTVADNRLSHSAIISLPNVDGQIEQFEVFEASNFEPDLQEQFPQIRAFSGKGITDKYATLKLSISPSGIQTMIFRTDKENEFIEPYSQDNRVYAVFRSERKPGQLAWTCSTKDINMFNGINAVLEKPTGTLSSAGELKTMRLAQSCNAEYANYFGATSATDVALVLAAFNATLTRCNGVYEKDLALHLNIIATSTSVIYYNPTTDPYTSLGNWNQQLQTALTTNIGNANYDIGHMFGASGGGGNAGCIGCVCVNPTAIEPLGKGSGITSPADGIPQGDNFDIDYVVHEVGHQLGGNHTYSHLNEGTGVNKEVGSGITIMGYAGITSQDVAPHSIDIFHQASIAQIQANLATKSCPVTTVITANNATPVVVPVSNYTIPRSTAFVLTGSAADANPGDALTYCWEQNNNSTTTGANSVASATKLTGPNWISFSPTASPTRYFPKLATILAGSLVSGPLPGGDAGANTEALSSVARTLNFRLTVRDNCPYSSTVPVKVGQTSFTDMIVTVSAVSGPFAITAPNTALTWDGGSSQAVTWSVANTNIAPVNCANVKILLSTDGGQTFPTVLSESTPNDGTETLVIPNTGTTTGRIKVEAVGNIFFDISNSNFTITPTCTTPPPIVISPVNYCLGATATALTASGPGLIWYTQPTGGPGSFTAPTPSTAVAGTVSYYVSQTVAGCEGTRAKIDVIVEALPVLNTPVIDQPTCAVATGTITVTSPAPAGLTYSINGVDYTNTTGVFSGLNSGSYNVTAKSANDCYSPVSVAVINAQPQTPTISVGTIVNNVCHGGTNGSITVTSGNGSSPVYTIISGPTINTTGQSSGIFTGLAAGSYTISVQSASGCSASANSIAVTEPAGTLPDISLGSDYSDNFFVAPGSESTIIFNVTEIAGNPATGDTIRIIKNAGYTFTFDVAATNFTIGATNYPLDNSRWKLNTSDPAFVSLIFDPAQNNTAGTINCGARVFVSVKLTRNTVNVSSFTLSARLRKANNEGSLSNNLNTITFTAE